MMTRVVVSGVGFTLRCGTMPEELAKKMWGLPSTEAIYETTKETLRREKNQRERKNAAEWRRHKRLQGHDDDPKKEQLQ